MPATSRIAAALLTLLPWLGCAAGRPQTGAVQGWADGPVRWLMLPEEERQARKLRTNREAVAFIEAFWRRRDPDLGAPGNPFAQAFYDRVDAADRLYTEGGRRGSLTDRGRALILLGPPPVLSYGKKPVPAWEPGRLGGKPAVQTKKIVVETWTYRAEDLAPEMRALLAQEEKAAQVVLVFVVEPERTYLTEGGKYLDLAVRASLRESP